MAERNTHIVGDRTEAVLMARLLATYDAVLLPFGNGRRYDMVVDTGKRFLRIQCKTGRLRKGRVIFNASSRHWQGAGAARTRHYRGDADYFGIYCPDNDLAYLVPVEDVGTEMGVLRVTPTRNNQAANIRWAQQYELRPDNLPL